MRNLHASLIVFMAVVLAGCSDEPPHAPVAEKDTVTVSPVIPPYEPVPTRPQLEWQRDECYLFVHFGLNTFSGKEWGEGTESSQLFRPSGVNTDQWASVAKKTGFKGIIITAKHHEGFALWPSAFTDFSIAHSPWKEGKGDLIAEVSASCRRQGVKFGVYLSPWDRHEFSYGNSGYDDFYVNQLTELLSNYGPVFEVWLDGAHADNVTPNYDMQRYHRVIRQLQPDALIASFGPDIQWVGNEDGIANETQWSIGALGQWQPVECDVTIRPGWFWREGENNQLKTEDQLIDIYFASVGRNGALLLNVPPDSIGLIHENDIKLLEDWRQRLDEIFAHNLVRQGMVQTSNTRLAHTGWDARRVADGNPDTFWATDDSVRECWLEVSFPHAVQFNTIDLREAIQYGQRVESYRVEVLTDNGWTAIKQGTTIGNRKLDRINTTTASRIRVVIESAKASPAISEFGLYVDKKRL